MKRVSLPSAFSAGLRYVAMSPNLLRVIARGFVFGLAAIACQALLPLVVREHLGGNALVYGILLGAFGFGAVDIGGIDRRGARPLRGPANARPEQPERGAACDPGGPSDDPGNR